MRDKIEDTIYRKQLSGKIKIREQKMIAMSNNNIEKFDKIKDDGEVTKGNKRR